MAKLLESEIIYKKLMDGGQTDDEPFSEESSDGPLTFFLRDIARNLETLEIKRENYAFRLIGSSHKALGPFIIFVKRAIRKILKWYIEPICFQQTDFNNAATHIAQSTLGLSKELEARSAEMEQTISALREEVKRLEERANQAEGKTVRIGQIEEMQRLENGHIVDLQGQMQKLRELDLDIFKEKPWSFWEKTTTSQCGEDSIIAFATSALGIPLDKTTYLDLGANHAKELSNTYFFYSHGARGVLVEANPALIPELKFYRHGDIILNCCVSDVGGKEIDFYTFSGTGDGLSTPDKDAARHDLDLNADLKAGPVVKITTATPNNLMETYLNGAPVLLNIDIEGSEMEILRSIDFQKYRPLVVVLEMIPYKTHLVVGEKNQEILSYMKSREYIEYAFTGVNSIFIDKKQIGEILK